VAREKWGKKFRSSRRAWGWPESKKEGAETVVRRRTEPVRHGFKAAAFRRPKCRKAVKKWLGSFQEGAERRDDCETERQRWTERPARRSSGVRMRGWRRTGQGALMGCSDAGGARNCGRGAAEMADDDEQSRRRWCGGGAERRRSRGAKMRVLESVNEVEEDSWMCCGNKKGTSELE
jgi:hypothetical protein